MKRSTTNRRREKNPAELLLMGANPHGQHYAVRWHTGRLSNSYASKEEAQAILDKFHGKGQLVLVNPLPIRGGRRRNPAELMVMGANPDGAEAARTVREGFVAKPSNHFSVTDEPHIPKGDYAELGDLVSLTVEPARGIGLGVKEINLDSSKIKVIASGNRKQIYFCGGDQVIDRDDLAKFTDKENGTVELGKCREIVYLAKKYHAEVGNSAAGKNVEWVHEFGEESGNRPVLLYSTSLDRLILRGGNYRVEDAGIID